MAFHQSRYFPIWLAIGLSFLATLAGLQWGADDQEQWQLASRYTARVGFPVFLISYLASSLVRLWPTETTRRLLRHRRQWGLAFALTHSVHLVALLMAYALAGKAITGTTLAGGGLAYALLYLMALTSNDASMRALGVWWKRLHTAGIHWLWFIFAFSYAGRLFAPETRAEGLIFTGLALAALVIRIAAHWKRRVAT